MIAPLREIQELVLAPAREVAGPPGYDPFLTRLASALRSVNEGRHDVGSADLAGLLRQGMLRCHLARGDVAELRVPRKPPWPDERTWSLFGCDAGPAGSRELLVRARSWEPVWLDRDAGQVVEAAVREEPRRQHRAVPADPRVTEYTGYTEYVSPGQREAVRAAFVMPSGSTLIVNLPTGGGKTLAFQLPALAWASESGLTLVIVPTVALARDQEERFRRLLERHPQGRNWAGLPLAYHSGLDGESRKAIFAGVTGGGMPILFASPEAALGALRGPLFEAARQGRLRYFVLDEAHIVSQWGDEFRPEFQSIAGLRESLLEACPADARFRTLLLTATLTSESYQTIQQLFGSEACQMVAEPALRPEPGFLLHSAPTHTEGCERVLDAVRHLPRPIILYTTRRDHAQEWYERLTSAGFRRVRLVRGGDLSEPGGERILQEWRDRAADIIVATSAFGLGVDQADVRSIVHACVPETIDRYYQEVGRAGRDGKASVALLVSAPGDLETAEGLAEKRRISVDRGFDRWDAMWTHRRPGTEGAYLISLNEKPPDLGESSKWNASWNLRTLVLMARAGLIQVTAHQPPELQRRTDEDAAAFETRRRNELERFSREVAVRILDARHFREDHWNDVVARIREEFRAADREGLRLVRELLQLRRPLNDIFRDMYTLDDPHVRPAPLAGSCPVTRREGTAGFRSFDLELVTLTNTAAELSERLRRALAICRDQGGRAWIAYDASSGDARSWRDQIIRLLRYLVSWGVVELTLPNGLLRDNDWYQLGARTSLRFLVRTAFDAPPQNPLAPEMPLPRVTILGERDASKGPVMQILQVSRPLHVIVLPRDVLDPDRPYRKLLDVVPHLSIDEFLARLGS